MAPEHNLERFTGTFPVSTGADGERLSSAWEEARRTGDVTPVQERYARRGRGSPNRTVGIIANPVSGRDVRRVAARGAVSTTEDKRNRIARAVIGAVTAGATRIVAMAEPFGIATGALTDLRIDAEIEIVDVGATVSPSDTVRAVEAMRARDVGVLMTLGGDGTNRTVSAVWPEATLVPMSTGTNNVFPSLTEPTVRWGRRGARRERRRGCRRLCSPLKAHCHRTLGGFDGHRAHRRGHAGRRFRRQPDASRRSADAAGAGVACPPCQHRAQFAGRAAAALFI